jgi:uncharacterized membrane protein YphA (DoxX/SURF4 family)
MRFSAYAGTAIIPLLARLVLCAAFLPAGYHKVFNTTTFEGDDAKLLGDLQVGQVASAPTGVEIRPASFARAQDPEEEAPPANAGEEEAADEPAADPEAQPVDPEASGQPVQPPPIDESALSPPPTDPVVTPVDARVLHNVTVLLIDKGWKREWKPTYMAWLAGLTELIGGGLLLVGLFSRLWGLGLAITMGFAFYLTTWASGAPFDPNLLKLAASADHALFNQMFCQLGLGVLALCVCLAGPGPLSLDRVLFGKPGRGSDLDELEAG